MALTCLALAALSALGCRSSGFDRAGSDIVPQPDAPELSARALMVETAEAIELENPDDPGERMLVRRTPPDEAGVWRIERLSPGAEDPVVVEMRLDDRGDAVSPRRIDPAEGVVVEFDPPLLVVPARSRVGDRVERLTDMIVRPIERRDRVKSRGEGRVVVEIHRAEEIDVGGEARWAYLVRSVFSAKIGPATTTHIADRWMVVGVGTAAERSDKTIRVFGIPTRREQTGFIAPGLPLSFGSDESAER